MKTFIVKFVNDNNIVEEDIEDALREYIHDSLDKDMHYDGEIIVEENPERTFLCRVPSSPVMDFQEFIEKHYSVQKGVTLPDTIMESLKDKFEGYLIGTRSIVSEISDENIKKWVKEHGYYGACTQEYHEGLEEGAKWYREQIRSQINK